MKNHSNSILACIIIASTVSAAEIAESGVSLGDSQRMLLEKVEELTLYAIEKDKRVTELESRLAALEAILMAN